MGHRIAVRANNFDWANPRSNTLIVAGIKPFWRINENESYNIASLCTLYWHM